MTPDFFTQVRPTYLENWPERLRSLSIRQIDIPLSFAEARALGSNIRHFGHWFGDGPPAPLDGIGERLGAALLDFPQGAFVRLGSRSGKDCDFAKASSMCVAGVRGALLLLTDGSERIACDLRLALRHGYSPHIFVRQWHAFPAWAEFRCFMHGRQLVGISQYDCVNLGPCAEIATQADDILVAIQAFFGDFREVVHLDNVVLDVFVEMDAEVSPPRHRVRLLELNPFLPVTDGCLFRWDDAKPRGGDFDGSFRYLRT